MEIEEEKEEVGSESSEPKLVTPAQPEQERQGAEPRLTEPHTHPQQTHQVKPKTGQESGGKRVADNREGIYEGFSKINESMFSLEGVRKAAAWYIEASEKLANQALELQERATGWAKDTPFAPLFEAQHSFARKFVERSANAARTLWQISPAQ